MKTKKVALSALICDSPFVTVEALQLATSFKKPLAPLVSEAFPGKYLVIDSVAKLAVAMQSTSNARVNVTIAPPIFLRRHENAYVAADLVDLSKPVTSYKEVQRARLRASYQYESGVSPRNDRGTIVKIYVDVSFPSKTVTYFINPLEHRIGAIFFRPNEAVNSFKPSALNAGRILQSWGTEQDYELATLPALVCVSETGQECFGIGSILDKAHRFAKNTQTSADLELNESDLPDKAESGRGRVTACRVLVLYPNGETYEGPAKLDENSVMMVWSERLVAGLIDSEWSSGYYERDWWNKPTSIILSGGYKPMCAHIEHTCNDCAIIK